MTGSSYVHLVRPVELASDVPYSYAAVAHGVSGLVFTAGACPLDETGATVSVGDLAGQTEQVMHNLEVTLQAAEARLTHVVKTTVYVASHDRADLVVAWNVVKRHFGEHDVPGTLLGVAVLGYPDQLVEVEAVAALW